MITLHSSSTLKQIEHYIIRIHSSGEEELFSTLKLHMAKLLISEALKTGPYAHNNAIT